MTRGVDPVLAEIFRGMRASLGMSASELARRIGATPGVVGSLEAGFIGALPLGPELDAAIVSLGRLVAVDVGPILARLHAASDPARASRRPNPAHVPHPVAASPPLRRPASGTEVRRATSPAPSPRARIAPQPAQPARQPAQQMAPEAPGPDEAAPEPMRLRQRLRALLPERRVPVAGRSRALAAALVPVLVVVIALWAVASRPSALHAAVDQLPPGVARSLRAGIDRVSSRIASGGDGLTWIEVADPGTRKADRLPVQGTR